MCLQEKRGIRKWRIKTMKNGKKRRRKRISTFSEAVEPRIIYNAVIIIWKVTGQLNRILITLRWIKGTLGYHCLIYAH